MPGWLSMLVDIFVAWIAGSDSKETTKLLFGSPQVKSKVLVMMRRKMKQEDEAGRG